MMRLKHSRFVLLLTAAAAVTALGTGCATSSQAQSGQWSPQDERAYREYLSEQHLPYQDFSLLGRRTAECVPDVAARTPGRGQLSRG